MSIMCPDCAESRARQAVHDHAYDMKHDTSLPMQAQCEFEEKFGALIVKIADWAAEYAEDWVLRQDHERCNEHRPTRADEE